MPRYQVEPPPLVNGDHLDRDEFMRRYEASPESVRAELVEGVVFMASPVSLGHHGEPHASVMAWLGYYKAYTPGTRVGDDATVMLDFDNVPQPDGMLLIDSRLGGQTRLNEKAYVEGAPELVVEVSATTASYDLHAKLHAYRRNGVREYVVWRVMDRALDWFVLDGGRFVPVLQDAAHVIRSRVFPGLWLDVDALLANDLARVFETVAAGIASEAHADFVKSLAR